MALVNLPRTLNKGLPSPPHGLSDPGHRVGLPKLPKALPAVQRRGLGDFPAVRTPAVNTNVPKPAGAGTPATGGKVDPNDPFQFIKGLMAPTDIAQIRALMDTVYGPQKDLINQQIAETAGQAKARADQMSQVYQAFAQYMQGLPDQIKGIYQQAGKDGYSAGQALMSGPQGGVGAKLGQFDQINSNLLSQESANWQSYAAAQPGIYSLTAEQNIKQMLGVAGQNENVLRQSLLQLSSKEADSILSYLQNAQAKDAQLQEWAYGQKQSQASAQVLAQQRDAQLKWNRYVTLAQLGQKADAAVALNDYRAAEVKLRQTSIDATNQRAAAGRTAANQRAAASLAQRRTTQNRMKPAPDSVSRSAGWYKLWDPVTGRYVTAVDKHGKPIPYKQKTAKKAGTGVPKP